MRLNSRDPCPPFEVTDIDGNHHSLQQYQGRKLLLCLFRYAGCPFCNLRIHQLISHYRQLQDAGIAVIAVFESSQEGIRKYVSGRQQVPFALVADPERKLYQSFGTENSWTGLLAGLLRIRDMFRAIFTLGLAPGIPENVINQLPADFLIDDGNIAIAWYGGDIGDHLPLDQVLASLPQPPGRAP